MVKKLFLSRTRDKIKSYRLSGDNIYQLIKPFLDNKMSVFTEYEPLNEGEIKTKISVFLSFYIFIDEIIA